MASERTFMQGSFRVVGGFEVIAEGEVITFDSDALIDVDDDASYATGIFDGFAGIPNGAGFESIQIGSQIWMRGEALGARDRWITFDIEEIAATNPQLAGMGSGMNDPRAAGNFLAGAEGMQETGVEEHNGETMTRYQGTVDFEKAAEAATPEQRDGIETTLGSLAAMGLSDAETTVWIDDAGYIREVSYVFAPLPRSDVSGIELRMFSIIDEIGGSWTIESPPERDVIDLSEG